MDTRVRYYAQGSRYAFYLTREEIVLVFMKESREMLGAMPLQVCPQPQDPCPDTSA